MCLTPAIFDFGPNMLSNLGRYFSWGKSQGAKQGMLNYGKHGEGAVSRVSVGLSTPVKGEDEFALYKCRISHSFK